MLPKGEIQNAPSRCQTSQAKLRKNAVALLTPVSSLIEAGNVNARFGPKSFTPLPSRGGRRAISSCALAMGSAATSQGTSPERPPCLTGRDAYETGPVQKLSELLEQRAKSQSSPQRPNAEVSKNEVWSKLLLKKQASEESISRAVHS